MEQLARIRRDVARLAALEAALAEHRAAGRPGAPARPGLFDAHPAAHHPDAFAQVSAALAETTREPRRSRLARLRAAIAENVARAAAAAIDDRLDAADAATAVEVNGTARPLPEALAAVPATADRGVRLAWEEAAARGAAGTASLRATRIERVRAALAALGGDDVPGFLAGLAGLDLDAAVADAGALLAATEDACRDALPWTVRRLVGEEVRPLPAGDLTEADLRHVAAARPFGGLFPSGGLLVAVLPVLEAIGLSPSRLGLVLEVDRDPARAPGAVVAALDVPRPVAISLRATGLPADFAALLGAVGEAIPLALVPPSAPVEDRRCRAPELGLACARLFSGLLGRPEFLRRVLGAPRAEAREASRALALARLLEARRIAALVAWEVELGRAGPSERLARAFADRVAAATFARTDPRLAFRAAGPGIDAARALRAEALAAALELALVERFDVDWFRNPRTGPFLAGLFPRGDAAEAAAIGPAPFAVAHVAAAWLPALR